MSCANAGTMLERVRLGLFQLKAQRALTDFKYGEEK